ncbi:hypothetical protein ASG42_30555 [Rhizobium sp. Leaf391]|nr:hypothetical protein ASG42_30555 [Rhizobium sp. Leaf391]
MSARNFLIPPWFIHFPEEARVKEAGNWQHIYFDAQLMVAGTRPATLPSICSAIVSQFSCML